MPAGRRRQLLLVRIARADERADVSAPFERDGFLERRHDRRGVLEVGVVGGVGDVRQWVSVGTVVGSNSCGEKGCQLYAFRRLLLATAGKSLLTRSVEAESPHVVGAECLAHISANKTLGTSDSGLTKGMKSLDERLESRQEEIVWTGEAEG